MTKEMNFLISKSKQGSPKAIKVRPNSDQYKNKLMLLQERYKTKLKDLEWQIRQRDSQLWRLQTGSGDVNKRIDIMQSR